MLRSNFPSYILSFAIGSLICINPASAATPGPAGFDNSKYEEPSAPNTVKGILTNGKDGDFALVRGIFFKKINNLYYVFQDDNADSIRIKFEDGEVPSDLALNVRYFMWTQIQKEHSEPVLKVVFISPRKK